MRRLVQGLLRRVGYQLVRNTRPPSSLGASHDEAALPEDLRALLNADNPRLVELRRRYAGAGLPTLKHTWWTQEYVDKTLNLTCFRGDNAYVWQTRHMPDAHLRYFLYATDVAARDSLGLFGRLTEDGAFGCWVYRSRRFPALSRDLLDSVNEINFLERHAGISKAQDLGVLDIGAGYGRLAHRFSEALPNLRQYDCTDGVAESTFLSEVYLDFRKCAKTRVVPGDETHRVHGGRVDLAINVHSFSEMSLAAIECWLDLVRELRVRYLFIVPNDAEAFLTIEPDNTRRDFLGAIESRGYREVAREPAIADHDVRELVGVNDYLFLFERRP